MSLITSLMEKCAVANISITKQC